MTTPTYQPRPVWKERAGQLALVLGIAALALGPLAALWVERDAAGELNSTDQAIERLDQSGTTAALARIEELDAELDRVEAMLVSATTALDAERAAREAAVAELRTLIERRPAPAAATPVRAQSTRAPATSSPRAVTGGDRWDALAACESAGDKDGVEPHNIKPDAPGGFITEFQFSADTARKVGAYQGMPYADAKAAAQRWAAEPTVDASSRAGWPTCWPLVMGNTPT